MLRFPFHATLGLSATARSSPINWSIPGLGAIVYEYTFEQAGKDGLVPPFDLVNCSTSFTPGEERQYLDLTETIGDQFVKVLDLYGCELRSVPDHLLFRRLRQLMMIDKNTEDPTIKRLFTLLFRRSALCYQATNKIALAMALIILMLQAGKKVMVFFERIESTEEVADIALATSRKLQGHLQAAGIPWCKVYHSQLADTKRKQILEDFCLPGPKALLSCRTLDEGIDIPEVDCAILAASTQSRRQRIQRIGRVLRRGEDGKRSTIVTLYVRGSGDENICAEDKELFGGPVTLHEVEDKDCLGFLSSLLGRAASTGNALA